MTKPPKRPAKRARALPKTTPAKPQAVAAAKPSTRWPWLEVAFAVVLSAAGLGSAWSSQQMRLWGGVQAEQFALATGLRAESARMQTLADRGLTIEVGLFSDWLSAELGGRHGLAEVYRRRFPVSLRTAFDKWWEKDPLNTPDSPSSPFEASDPRPERLRALQLEEDADGAFGRARDANQTADRFGQVNVILATAMFLAGVGNHFEGRRVRLALMAIGAACCLLGLLRLFQLPLSFAS